MSQTNDEEFLNPVRRSMRRRRGAAARPGARFCRPATVVTLRQPRPSIRETPDLPWAQGHLVG